MLANARKCHRDNIQSTIPDGVDGGVVENGHKLGGVGPELPRCGREGDEESASPQKQSIVRVEIYGWE